MYCDKQVFEVNFGGLMDLVHGNRRLSEVLTSSKIQHIVMCVAEFVLKSRSV